MKKTVIAFMAIVTLTTVGCKKEAENETQAVTKENVAGSYKTSSLKISINGSAEADITNDDSYSEACERDDIMKLNADLTFANVDAGTQCSPSSEDTGSWKVVNSNTIEVNDQSFTVKSLTKKQMVLTQTESSSGITATVTATLDKQ